MTQHASTPSLPLVAKYLDEPALTFAVDRQHVVPKVGLSIFGPRSLGTQRHPDSIKLGYIGTGSSTAEAREWIASCRQGVPGDNDNLRFPGFSPSAGFFADVVEDDSWFAKITQNDLKAVSNEKRRRDRFGTALDILTEKAQLLGQRDRPPDIVVLALPDELVEQCRSVEYSDGALGRVHLDFRRSLKSRLMQLGLPSQILLERTTTATPGARGVDHRSRVAWNFFSSFYFKAGGIPWSPTGLRANTCYVGVSFYRALGTKRSDVRTSVAQAFDETGDGLVLRGPDFAWDQGRDGPSPHLSEAHASELIGRVLARYRRETGRTPSRVVVHKTSLYWPEERAGFESGLSEVSEYDLVAVAPVRDLRLLRSGQYPALRGAWVRLGTLDLLYTTGYIAALKAYPHGHVPVPLRVTGHVGDSDIETVLREILVLTKMNWNSANFGGLLPVTLGFARRVGEIMREAPDDQEPQPQFKFYI